MTPLPPHAHRLQHAPQSGHRPAKGESARPPDRNRHPGSLVPPIRWGPELAAYSSTYARPRRPTCAAHEGAGEAEGFVDETTWEQCRQVIADTFGPAGSAAPQAIFKSLAAATEVPRHGWPMSLLRRIWDTLLEYESGRRRSPVHETLWLNLAGYALRPGYGLALDDWRVAETWRALQGKIAHRGGVPHRVLDPLAADRRWSGSGPAAGDGTTADCVGAHSASAADWQAGPRGRGELHAARISRAMAPARLAGTAGRAAEDRAGWHGVGPDVQAQTETGPRLRWPGRSAAWEPGCPSTVR